MWYLFTNCWDFVAGTWITRPQYGDSRTPQSDNEPGISCCSASTLVALMTTKSHRTSTWWFVCFLFPPTKVFNCCYSRIFHYLHYVATDTTVHTFLNRILLFVFFTNVMHINFYDCLYSKVLLKWRKCRIHNCFVNKYCNEKNCDIIGICIVYISLTDWDDDVLSDSMCIFWRFLHFFLCI